MQILSVALGCLFLIVSFDINVLAASSFFDYHVRVHQASLQIASLLGGVEEDVGHREYEERVKATLSDVRAMLPPAETVELDKKTIEVNNVWLHSEIGYYYQLNSYDKERAETLIRIAERLNALDWRLTEVDGKKLTNEKSSTRFPVNENPNQPSTGQTKGAGGQTEKTTIVDPNSNEQRTEQLPSGQGSTGQDKPQQGTTPGQTTNQNQTQPNNAQTGQPNPDAPKTKTRDKEAEKAKMNEILHRDEFSKKPPEESAIERFFNWLFNQEPQKKEPQKQIKPITPLAQVIQYLVIGIAFAAIAFVLWKLVPRFLRRERKAKKEKRKPRVILGEKLEEDQTSADLLAEADKLARAGDIRGAIRKGYIALLCELGDRKVLSLEQYKTNRDYLRDVRTRIMLYATMEQMTNTFERHWYGFEPTNESDWNNFRNNYQQAVKN